MEIPPSVVEESRPGDVVVLTESSACLVILHGEIDLRMAHELEDAARYCIDSRLSTELDVRQVTRMDSVGVSFIVRLAAALQQGGHRPLLRGPCRPVAELVELVEAGHLVEWMPR